MQSPTPPGRMASRRLFNNDGELDFECLRRQARTLIAGLIADLAGHHRLAWFGVSRDLEIGHDIEAAGVDRERFLRERVLLHCGFRILDLGHLQRARSPGELEGDQVFIARRVAVAVVAFAHAGLDFDWHGGSALAHDRHGRGQRHGNGLAEAKASSQQQA